MMKKENYLIALTNNTYYDHTEVKLIQNNKIQSATFKTS